MFLNIFMLFTLKVRRVKYARKKFSEPKRVELKYKQNQKKYNKDFKKYRPMVVRVRSNRNSKKIYV